MKPNSADALQVLERARTALLQGDKRTAWQWIERAIALDPDSEEPWLMLAGAFGPRASIAYLEKALKINPNNVTAKRELERNREILSHSAVSHAGKGDTFLKSKRENRGKVNPGRDQKTFFSMLERQITLRRHTFVPLLVLIGCACIAWLFWSGSSLPGMAYLRENSRLPQAPSRVAGAPAEVAKPTHTPSPTPTFTPSPTSTPTTTPTLTPTFTPTITPSPVPLPTLIPQYPTRVSNQDLAQGAAGERWIDVNLSSQRLYAFEGNTLMATFIVSTGISIHPTVTGQYHIYTKLLYTDMSGPGYYLPNVPYTMYFYKGYGLHGTYWHNNFGVPMSHGCINLTIPDAGWLFDFASIGTLVNIHY